LFFNIPLRNLRAIAFTGAFFDFSKKDIFKGYFDLFFDREELLKKVFCIINLVHSQVHRVEKVGKYLLYLSKKSSFYFSDILIKSRILTRILGFSGPVITLNIFKNNIFLINSIRAFDWCMNLHTSFKKKIVLLDHKGGPLPKKSRFFFVKEVTAVTKRFKTFSSVYHCYKEFKSDFLTFLSVLTL
jgi:hypothetical protein